MFQWLALILLNIIRNINFQLMGILILSMAPQKYRCSFRGIEKQCSQEYICTFLQSSQQHLYVGGDFKFEIDKQNSNYLKNWNTDPEMMCNSTR